MTCRVLTECTWSPDGHSEFRFGPGTVLSDGDPRVANGFLTVARREGWVEVIAEAQPSPAVARVSPASARLSPARSKRTAPRQKTARKPKKTEEA